MKISLLPRFAVLCFFNFTAAFIYSGKAECQHLLDPYSQPQFVNALPIPPMKDGREGDTFTISIRQFQQDLGLKDPQTGQPMLTTVWGYDGSYPGPTIIAREKVPLYFFWRNQLYEHKTKKPLPHLLPVDTSIMWALADVPHWEQYGVPVVTHLHGGHTEAVSDGYPEAWFTPLFQKTGPAFVKGDDIPYTYANDRNSATLFYHDHALGITRLNVYAGLIAFYIITDDHEEQLKAEHKLPANKYDIPLVIQDKMFTDDGQLFFPSKPEEPNQPSPSILPEFFGDFILVNGKIWPVLDVEPRQYRFRILDGSDSRFYNLSLSNGQKFIQIGSDQGLLPSPVAQNELLLAPAERKEVIIDFSDPSLSGQTIIVRNNAKIPFPSGETVDPKTDGLIMAFRVTKPLNTDIPLTKLDERLRTPIDPLVQTGPERQLLLFETEDEYGRIEPILGTVHKGALHFEDPVTENIKLGDTEIWDLYNATEDAHPIHIHQVRFQTISRQKFKADINQKTGQLSDIRLLGQPKKFDLEEDGWKDTQIALPGEVTRVIAKFDLPGEYVWHCHITSHEDHDMMRPFIVSDHAVASTQSGLKQPSVANYLRVYPNPATSFSTVQFKVGTQSKISVKVYDMQQREVKSVFEGVKPAGVYELTLNTTGLSAGIYICRMISNNGVVLQRLIIQR